MKIAYLIARVLIGLQFVIFGLNGLHDFMHMPIPTGLAGQYVGALAASRVIYLVAALEVVAGLLLLANRFVPIGLVILGPILVNILAFHILISLEGLPIALITLALYLIVFFAVRKAFTGVFAAKVEI